MLQMMKLWITQPIFGIEPKHSNWMEKLSWNDLPKLSPHNADDIKCNTNKIIPNGKRPAIIVVCTALCVFLFLMVIWVWFGFVCFLKCVRLCVTNTIIVVNTKIILVMVMITIMDFNSFILYFYFPLIKYFWFCLLFLKRWHFLWKKKSEMFE